MGSAIALPTLTQAQWRALLAVTYNSYAVEPLDDSEGEPLDALFNAMSIMATQVQGQVVLAAAVSRVQSSGGFDVDTFWQQFGVLRNKGTFATGPLEIQTPLLSQPLTVQFGTVVQSKSGALYAIVADPAQPAYTPSGYVFNAATTGGLVTITCTQRGSVGNAIAGDINALVAGPGAGPPPTGILAVWNPYDITNGIDDELDPDYTLRAQTQVTSGNVGTALAILAAVLAIQPGLTVSYGDKMQPNGAPSVPGSYSIVLNVRGQTTPPSTDLLNAAAAAVDGVCSAGDFPYIAGPTFAGLAITGSLLLAIGADPIAVPAAANAAVTAYINSIGLDLMGAPVTLSRARLAQAILGVAGVVDVVGLQINAADEDVIAPYGTQLTCASSSLVASTSVGVLV